MHSATGGLVYRSVAHELLDMREVANVMEDLTTDRTLSSHMAPHLAPKRVMDTLVENFHTENNARVSEIMRLEYGLYRKTPSLLYDWHGLVDISSKHGYVWLLARYNDRNMNTQCRCNEHEKDHTVECRTIRDKLNEIFMQA